MLSKFLSDKVCIAKAWSGFARYVLDSYLYAPDTLAYMVMVEIGEFNNVIVQDGLIAEIYARDIASIILKNGWENLPVEETARLIQTSFDFENEEVKEKFKDSEVILIQRTQEPQSFQRRSSKKYEPA